MMTSLRLAVLFYLRPFWPKPIAQHVSNGASHNPEGAWKMFDALVIRLQEWHFIRNSKSVQTALAPTARALPTAARLDE